MNKPAIIHQDEFSEQRLHELRKTEPEERDFYEKQLHELFEITYPAQAKDNKALDKFLSERGVGDDKGSWVFFPWSNKLIHIVGEDDFFALRTNRNRNLITTKEQQILLNKTVGVAGMSVGAWIAIGCAYSGISNSIHIADGDYADTTNMNRLQIGVQDLYTNKAVLAMRRIYEANPFANATAYERNLTNDNIDDFFSNNSQLDIIVDEVDDFKMKIMLRTKAKEAKIPLLMMTSIGDNMLIDIERYDIDENTKPFLGKADEAVERIGRNDEITLEDMKRYSVELVERKHVPVKALESVAQIGQTLVGRPQLYSTVSASDGVAVMIIREILLGATGVDSGRYYVDLSQITKDSAQ